MFYMKKMTVMFLAVLMAVSVFASPVFAKINGNNAMSTVTWYVGKAFTYDAGQFFTDSAGKALSYSGLTFLMPDTETAWTKSIAISSSGILTGNAPADIDKGEYLLTFVIKDSTGNSIEAGLPITITDGPTITVNPTYWFDQSVYTYIGDSLKKTFTVSNTGNQDLIIGTITISGTNASEFTKQNDTASGKTLSSGQSATFDIVFTPTTAGDKIATVNIPSNAPSGVSVNLYPRAMEKPPTPTVPTAPLLSIAIADKTVTASWSSSSNASGYTLWYASASNPSQFFAADVENSTSFSIELWGGAEFYVKLQAYNSAGSSEYSNVVFFRILAEPVITVSTTGSNVTASWTPVSGASGYMLYYAPYPNAEYIGSYDMQNQTSITLNIPGAAFYVAVKAYKDSAFSNFSNIGHFVTQ